MSDQNMLMSSSGDFCGMPEICSHLLKQEYGSFNLLEEIRSAMISSVASNDIILIRRIHTDQLFPYDAGTFLTWWFMSEFPSDPITREDLSYITLYVELKQEMFCSLQNIALKDVTSEFRLNLLTEYVNLIANGQHVKDYHKFRYFLDVVTWKKGHYIFDFTCAESVAYISQKNPNQGMWMMRKSSKHRAVNTMKNSECITFTIQTNNRGIIHVRSFHVIGVGWFLVPTNVSFKTFKEFSMKSGFHPKYATFVEMIEYFVRYYDLDWKKLLQVN